MSKMNNTKRLNSRALGNSAQMTCMEVHSNCVYANGCARARYSTVRGKLAIELSKSFEVVYKRKPKSF